MRPPVNKSACVNDANCGAIRQFARVQSKIQNPKSQIRNRRSAFTLVELLVVMVIIAMLAALALGTLRRTPEDRINATARQLQSQILLARSLAGRDQRITGLRLLQKAGDPWIVDGVELISSPGYDTGTASVGFDTVTGTWVVTNDTLGEWGRLAPVALNANGRGLIRAGQRVELPAGSGRWYVISSVAELVSDNRFTIQGHYTPSVSNGSGGFNAVPNVNVPYRLELAPTATAGQEPLRFQPGVGIDLAGCRNVIDSLEILFAPGQGLVGENASGGNIFLYLATLEDIELSRNLPMVPPHPVIASPTVYDEAHVITVPANVSTDPAIPGVPKTEPAALAIFAQTGNVISVPVDLTPVSAADLRANDPYVNARRGKELSR